MEPRDIIQSALDYIETHLEDGPAPDDLCRLACYSRAHFCRLFQQFTGMPPGRYMTRRRLLHAVYKMASGSSKTEAAFAYGFSSYAGFYKAFVREFGCGPSAFTKHRKAEKPYRINLMQEEYKMITKDEIRLAAAHWGLQAEEIRPIYNENTGRKNERACFLGTRYVLKFSANLGTIQTELCVAEQLGRAGLPVAEAVKSTDTSLYVPQGELYFYVTKRLSGQPLHCSTLLQTPSLAETIGENIAQLHRALQAFDETQYAPSGLAEEVENALPEVLMRISPAKMPADFAARFAALYETLPKQVIHRDLSPGNMLFEGEQFRGFLDFEMTQTGARLFDICYCATAILSESFSAPNIHKIWPEILKYLLCGYGRIAPLSEEEIQAVPMMLLAIQTICVHHFSRLDKYESLAKINTEMLLYLLQDMRGRCALG